VSPVQRRLPDSLKLPVLAPDGADAHALEALGDRVAEEAERLDALREEIAIDHRPAPVASDVLHALISLGYSDKEAVNAVKQLPDGVALADGIRQALKLLAKA